MDTYKNKTAFITGAASGIGLALTKALTAQGANVMMADINGKALTAAAKTVKTGRGKGKVETIICDVIKPLDVKTAAKATQNAFGNVHMVFNNAGVGLAGKPGNIPLKDWRWITDINLMGVVYGVEMFVPMMTAHGEPSHIINTASMAGHMTMGGMAPYHATKFAVVGYSESLAQELAATNIGVSVLCPTWVKSNIYNGAAGRPTAQEKSAPKSEPDEAAAALYNMTKGLVDNGMTAEKYAALVLKSVLAGRFYVFNDPEARAAINMRRASILKDYDACLADLNEM